MIATSRVLSLILLAGLLSGCSPWRSRWAFERIEVLETTQTGAANVMPAPVKTTAVSLVPFKEAKNPPGLEALVCVLDRQGQVVGKIAVQTRRENWGLAKKESASVQAELAPLPEKQNPDAGPVYQLRAVLGMLRRKQGEFVKDQGHALACAAILRILETLPGVTTSAPDRQQFADMLELDAPNRTLTCSVTDRRTYLFVYQVSTARRARVTYETT